MYTQASVALIDGWAIKLRYTALAPDEEGAQRAEAAANMIWRSVLSEIVARPAGS